MRWDPRRAAPLVIKEKKTLSVTAFLYCLITIYNYHVYACIVIRQYIIYIGHVYQDLGDLAPFRYLVILLINNLPLRSILSFC